MSKVEVLIPTYSRLTSLSMTMTSLCYQNFRDFNVIISDQTEGDNPCNSGEIQSITRILRKNGHDVVIHKHLPRRGIAEHRQFLLDCSTARFVLFLDDDIYLEPPVIDTMAQALEAEKCGLVGQALIGLSFIDDIRPQEQSIEFWDGPVVPEEIRPDTKEWRRHRLHNAANILHVQNQLGITWDQVQKYRIAWVGGCVMYDAEKLRDVGGYHFWRDLPVEHCGEDVLVQWRVMAKYGGCGLLPSGVYHLELPTTICNRNYDAPRMLRLYPMD